MDSLGSHQRFRAAIRMNSSTFGGRRSDVKLRNYLVLPSVLLFVVALMLFAYGMVQEERIGDDELVHSAYWSDKEEKHASTSRTGKEESSPIEVDGKAGKLWKGWYANGKQRYEHIWIADKQHDKQLDWNDEGQ